MRAIGAFFQQLAIPCQAREPRVVSEEVVQAPTRRVSQKWRIARNATALLTSGSAPKVEVTLRIYRVSNFDVKLQTFHADFVAMFDWIDPHLVGMAKEDIDWDEHFVPNVVVNNAETEIVGDLQASPRLFSSEKGWARLSVRYRGVLQVEVLDMRAYPFDEQVLRISLRAMRYGIHMVALVDPVLRPSENERYRDGHQCDLSAIQLDQWELQPSTRSVHRCPAKRSNGITAVPYDVQIYLRRRCDYAMWNLCLPTFLLTCLSFVVFAMSPEDLSGRMQITLTLLLTLITFKQLMASELPPTAYLTTLDRYMLYAIVVPFSNGIEHAVAFHLGASDPKERQHQIISQKTFEMSWVLMHAVCFLMMTAWLWYKRVTWSLLVRKATNGAAAEREYRRSTTMSSSFSEQREAAQPEVTFVATPDPVSPKPPDPHVKAQNPLPKIPDRFAKGQLQPHRDDCNGSINRIGRLRAASAGGQFCLKG
mmetsp:Transcript_19396/g.42365  ORF Transcript_19396/g.42365 Transcript_19396/m.42365 type:complete len:479 (-) Transcript_19396:94-1530(-)